MTDKQRHAMTPGELRSTLTLAGIFALRMLGLFMILPVFALYAEHLEHVTPVLVGMAIGAYGLTQAVFQIPFGMLSDRLGRKRIIVAGLLLFAAGSVVAALSTSIYGVILGRALQGSGAIASALMAFVADLTREDHRTKAMALMGMSIGLSFSVAMVVGPVLNHWVGVPGIFWTTAGLALVGIAVLRFLVPDPVHSTLHRDTEAVPAQFRAVLHDPQLLRLDFGVLVLHMMLTATFVVVPLALRDVAGLSSAYHSYVYLVVLGLSVVAMVPFIILAEKKRVMKPVFVGAVLVVSLGELSLWEFHASLLGIGVGLFLFFAAFNVLEASLPSLISKQVRPDSKGTAMGVFSSAQFFGAFLGGSLGGLIHGHFGLEGVFLFCAASALLWVLVAVGMQPPRYLSSLLLKVGKLDPAQANLLASRLTQVPGVAEAVVVAEEEVAYLKVDNRVLDEEALQQFAAA